MKTFIDRYIEQGHQSGLHQGLHQGLQQGLQQGQVNIVLQQLKARFGNIPEWVREKIECADTKLLEKWSIRLLDAAKIEDVLN